MLKTLFSIYMIYINLLEEYLVVKFWIGTFVWPIYGLNWLLMNIILASVGRLTVLYLTIWREPHIVYMTNISAWQAEILSLNVR